MADRPSPCGERHGRAKLTEEQVLDARRRFIPNHSRFGSCAFARRLKVSKATMQAAIDGRNWRHLPKVGKYDGANLEHREPWHV